ASYEQLSEAYAAAGKYQNAFEHKSRYGQLKDSLRGAEVAGRIAEVNTKYDLAEKDRLLVQNQLQLANHQLKIKNQYLLVGIILAATFFAVLIFTFILRKRKHRAEIDRLRSHIAGEEQEKNRMARELHDGIVSWLSIIKTNLSNLPEPVLESEMEQRLNVINQLDQGIDELRTTSHNLLPEILTQAGLLGALRHFCHKINQTKSLDITFQHFGALPSLTDDSQLKIGRA